MASLVFSAIFFVMAGSLVNMAQSEHRANLRRRAHIGAGALAEAGLSYYRWHLAHAPNDFKDGTGQAGPYVHQYHDPAAGLRGTFSLDITPPNNCNSITTVTSTGSLTSAPDIKKTFTIHLGQPTIANYMAALNSNVWLGGHIVGRVHSNGGIRMDGTQNSLFTSAKAAYVCGPEHGRECNPPQNKPGIWGSGQGGSQGLWQFPAPPVNFAGITQDLQQFKIQAIANNTYLGPSGSFGYLLKLLPGGRIQIHRITTLLPPVWGYNGTKWVYESNDFAGAPTLQRELIIPANTCDQKNLVFVEDRVWVAGSYDYPLTIVAARFIPPVIDANILIHDNLINLDQTKGRLGLIAQNDILIPLHSADNLRIDAALIAQKGHVFRNYYSPGSRTTPWYLRNNLDMTGSVVSSTIWAWTWVDTNGRVVNGYRGGSLNFNSRFSTNPPPFFPVTGDFQQIDWQEKR